jgi:Proton-conducting membrane transporter/LAGLIDADG endonuclease
MNAMFTNRVGDFFLTIGFFAIFYAFGTLDYGTVFALSSYINVDIITFIIILLLLGAAAKSAQIGLHIWLPMAMEGPTPVSALIHAATMVTAGVYLLIRCSPLLEQSQLALLIITVTGAVTSFVAASVGLFQNDIKKIIAYSTMSQLAREYIIYNIFRQRTICVKLILLNICNSQITKAHNYISYNYISDNLFNSFSAMRQYFLIYIYNVMSEKWEIIALCRLVGISEAIRLLLIIHHLKYNVNFLYRINNIFFYIINSLKHFYLMLISFIFYHQQRVNVNYITSYLIFFLILINLIHNYNLIIYVVPALLVMRELREYVMNRRKLHSISLLNNKDNLTSINREFKANIISNLSNEKSYNEDKDKVFFEWLAGVIDGDGYFHLSKKGTARFTVTMDIRDKKALYEIKQKLGGSIYTIANANALRYQLSHKKGLILLINEVNGLIRNSTRLLQMNKLCVKYGINILYPKPLTYYNGWLSGFIDSDGSIYLNEASGQIFISATQKNKYLLEPLIPLYGGRVDIFSPKVDAFKYIVYRKNEIINLIDNYFSKYPLRTLKANRLRLIKQFYLVRISKKNKDINKLHEWILFKDKWEKFSD